MNRVRQINSRSPFFDLDDFFDKNWSPFYYSATERTSRKDSFSPRVDIEERETAFELSVELPGVSKEDIKVTLSDGVLSLEAQCRQSHSEEKNGKFLRQERRYGKYVRQFQLGDEVQESDVSASLKDGILKLHIPKAEPKKLATRQIEILSH